MVQQRRQVAADEGDQAVAGSSRSSSADSRAKVAWGSKLGTARSTPTTISLTPRTAL
jgi:hypothetical protein